MTKVKLEIVLDIPDVEEFDSQSIGQAVFDAYTNYVVVQHLQDSMYWLARPTIEGGSKAADKLIASHHKTWADIAKQARDGAKVTILE